MLFRKRLFFWYKGDTWKTCSHEQCHCYPHYSQDRCHEAPGSQRHVAISTKSPSQKNPLISLPPTHQKKRNRSSATYLQHHPSQIDSDILAVCLPFPSTSTSTPLTIRVGENENFKEITSSIYVYICLFYMGALEVTYQSHSVVRSILSSHWSHLISSESAVAGHERGVIWK